MSLREKLAGISGTRRAVAAGVVLAIGIVAAIWAGSGKEERDGGLSSPGGPILSEKRSADESPIQMPEFSTGLAIEKIRQDIDRMGDDRQKDLAEVEEIRKTVNGHTQILNGFGAQLNDIQVNLAAFESRLVEALRAAQAGGEEGGRRAGGRPSDIPPIQMDQPPPPKQESRAPGLGRVVPQAGGLQVPSDAYFLPAGSMVKVKLLNGVEAPPAAQGPGLPMLFLVQESFIGPNSYTIPMRGCLVLGRADGDLSAERVRIPVHALSCVFPGGRTLDRAITGYIAGPDGRFGIAGKVYDKRGRRLGMQLLTGFTAGLNQALAMTEVTRVIGADGTERQIVTGDTLRYGVQSGLASALGEVANFYREEMRRMFPVVLVQSGIEAVVVLEQGVDVPEVENLLGGKG